MFEGGLVRDMPASRLLYTMGGLANITGSLWATRMVNLMGLMAAGEVQLGFIGGAEIDRYGNLNTSMICPLDKSGGYQHPTVRLPGSSGAAEIASLSHRLAIILPPY